MLYSPFGGCLCTGKSLHQYKKIMNIFLYIIIKKRKTATTMFFSHIRFPLKNNSFLCDFLCVVIYLFLIALWILNE